ncbi:MAG: hypothetical protein WBE13_16415, partial [Candidatus Acidiferrum sp.]
LRLPASRHLHPCPMRLWCKLSHSPWYKNSGWSAQKSGGPRTQRGKDKSKLNALKYGLFSKAVLLKDEPRAEFDYLLNGLRNDFQPVGMLEVVLVDELAVNLWRQRRHIIADRKRLPNGTDSFGLGLNLSESEAPSLDLLLRYETNLDRAFDRILNQLDRLQRIRKGQPVPPTVNVNLST